MRGFGILKTLPNWEDLEPIVKMDETYLPGQPKYHRRSRLGTTWKCEDKWVCD